MPDSMNPLHVVLVYVSSNASVSMPSSMHRRDAEKASLQSAVIYWQVEFEGSYFVAECNVVPWSSFSSDSL